MELRIAILKSVAEHHGRYTFRAAGHERRQLDEFQSVAGAVQRLQADGLIEFCIPHYSQRHAGQLLESVTAVRLTLAGKAVLRASAHAA